MTMKELTAMTTLHLEGNDDRSTGRETFEVLKGNTYHRSSSMAAQIIGQLYSIFLYIKFSFI